MRKKILIVEDNQDMRFLYKRLFRKEKEVELFETDKGENALKLIQTVMPDLVIVDISLPGMSGLDLVEKLHEQKLPVKTIVVTGHEVSRYYDEAMKRGADDLVSKEIGKELVERCKELLQ